MKKIYLVKQLKPKSSKEKTKFCDKAFDNIYDYVKYEHFKLFCKKIITYL